jgi:hypothetical protein
MEVPGRYRRAFGWRLDGDERDETVVAATAFAGLFSSEMPAILEDYLDISRRRRDNRLALARLQAHLVEELISVEATIKHYRIKKTELESAADPRQIDPEQDGTKRDLKFINAEIFLYRAFANVIRSITDGVAWRALGFDRAVLRALCQNRGSQQITSPGTVEELREWSRQFDSGQGIAILNSLTNWLTYGDITLVRNDGSIELLEVKSSGTTSNRVVRQKQRMHEVVSFIGSGRGSLEGKTVEVCSLDIVPENGLNVLHGLLQQTSNHPGYAATRLSNSAYVECIDFRVSTDGGGASLLEQRESLTSDWVERSDHVDPSDSLECLAFSPNLAPFSVFPFAPSICVDVLTGAKAYRVLLNLSAVAREFEYRGWQVTMSPRQAVEADKFREGLMTVKKGDFTITLPPALFMRMQMELLRPQVLIRQCELLKKSRTRDVW